MASNITAPAPWNGRALTVVAAQRRYAVPLEHVIETMRPRPVDRMPGVPHYVVGVSLVRGVPTPVVDLHALVDSSARDVLFGRFVTIRAGERQVALAVENVEGVQSFDLSQWREMPPLLRDTERDVTEAIGLSDVQLLLVLRVARMIPDSTWSTLVPKLSIP